MEIHDIIISSTHKHQKTAPEKKWTRTKYGWCHAQIDTLPIFDAIACIIHEAPLLPFFFYLHTPKLSPLALHLA